MAATLEHGLRLVVKIGAQTILVSAWLVIGEQEGWILGGDDENEMREGWVLGVCGSVMRERWNRSLLDRR